MARKKKCIAIHRGYDGHSLIEPGQTFHYAGEPAPWFKLHPDEKADADDEEEVQPEASKAAKAGKGSKDPKPTKGAKEQGEPEASKLPDSSGDESVI